MIDYSPRVNTYDDDDDDEKKLWPQGGQPPALQANTKHQNAKDNHCPELLLLQASIRSIYPIYPSIYLSNYLSIFFPPSFSELTNRHINTCFLGGHRSSLGFSFGNRNQLIVFPPQDLSWRQCTLLFRAKARLSALDLVF